MIEILLFVAPIFIAVGMHNSVLKQDRKLIDTIMIFGKYLCIINLCSLLVLKFYAQEDFYLDTSIYRVNFIIKYMIINCVFASIIPVVVAFISKNFSFKLELKKNDKKNTKK